ncbi:MAG: ROK family protein [Bacteroidia bacterium]|nr:ROK family protein [Bacteroidia bacterium]
MSTLSQPYIGIDLGGTQVRAGLVGPDGLIRLASREITSQGSQETVMAQVMEVVTQLEAPAAAGIGIGVPGLVDLEAGVVFDVMNIPAWREVPVKTLLEARFGVPVAVNNDANCFALAEAYFGAGRGVSSFVGLIIGTGIAGGIIIGGQLYAGRNCGAGEFGMIPYLDHHFEHYCCGPFFERTYGIPGPEAYRRAMAGDAAALGMWEVFGSHVGKAIESILYSYDPELIVLGGSVGAVFPMYALPVWEVLHAMPFRLPAQNLRIEVSELEQPGVLGAAALAMTMKG